MSERSPEKQRCWDRHFLRLCLENARLSRDPSTRVGALIVGPDLEVRSMGMNGFPRGIADLEDRLNDRKTKNLLVVHGEMNAVLAAARVGIPLLGCTLYLAAMSVETGETWGGPPCTRCTVEIIQAGIVEVVTWPFKAVPSRWKDDITAALALLKEAGIKYREVERAES